MDCSVTLIEFLNACHRIRIALVVVILLIIVLPAHCPVRNRGQKGTLVHNSWKNWQKWGSVADWRMSSCPDGVVVAHVFCHWFVWSRLIYAATYLDYDRSNLTSSLMCIVAALSFLMSPDRIVSPMSASPGTPISAWTSTPSTPTLSTTTWGQVRHIV